MKVFFIFLFILYAGLKVYRHFHPKKEDAFCYMVFGSPGTGKTTLAVKYAQQALKKGIKVFTNFPCSGCFQLITDEIGIKQYPNSLCIIDEAGIDFNNRDYKKFPRHTLEYFKLHRHYNTSFICLSQGWDDCDKKIRTLCSQYYYLGKIGLLTFVRRIKKRVGVDDTTHDIVDAYVVPHIFQKDALSFCWRPRWYKYFNSWEAPKLPDAEEKEW